MKICFLGTSHGHSEKGRYCTSVFFEHNGRGYIIDLGAPVEYILTNKGFDTDLIDAFFITHMHIDHIADLPTIIKDYGLYNKNETAKLFLPQEEVIEPLKKWIDVLHMGTDVLENRLKPQVVKEGLIYEANGIRVTAIRTRHLSEKIPSFSYMVETDDGRRVLFTGDLAFNHTDFPRIAKEEKFDLIVSELVHLPMENVEENFKDVKTDMLIFSHLGECNIRRLEEINPKMPFPFVVACDGFEYFVR